MAQYSKNFYGASYYGRRGTFGGQYTSEEISSGNALTGALTNTLVAVLPSSTYKYNSNVFLYTGATADYTSNSTVYRGINVGSSATITLTGSDISLTYLRKADGGKMRIQTTTTVDGVEVFTHDVTIDTAGTEGPILALFPDLPFGEQQIILSHGTGSTTPFYIENITARTADVTVETRCKTGLEGTWGAWSATTVTGRTLTDVEDCYSIVSSTPTMANNDYYQFRIMLGTSDDTVTPIVKSCKFTRDTSNNYSTTGQYRVRIDLGANVKSIDNLTYTATVPDGTKLYIRTRTNATEPFVATDWSSWSAPYMLNLKRFRLKSYSPLQANNPISEYIITPVINPQDPVNFITLQKWISFISKQYVTDQNTNIRFQVLDKDLNRLTYKDNTYTNVPGGLERYVEFLSTVDGPYEYDTSVLKAIPIRLKIILNRSQGALSSPVVDLVTYRAMAKYKEIKEFSDTGFRAYASPVYGNNTGVIDLTFNDISAVGDGTLTKPANLNFTVPTPIGGTIVISPDYVIDTTSDTFGIYKAGKELNLYWKSSGNTPNKKSSTTDANDILVAYAKAWPESGLERETAKAEDKAHLYKYYQYGRGFIIYPDVNTLTMSNLFSPSIDSSLGNYSYYVANGWVSVDGTQNSNSNITVAWNSNIANNVSNISQNNGSKSGGILYNDSVKISVIAPNSVGEVTWISDEKIFDSVINEDGVYKEKIIAIEGTDIPEIDSDVSITDNPYVADIVYRSVECDGKIVPEERIKVAQLDNDGNPVLDTDGKIIYNYPMVYYGSDSFVEATKYRAAVVRGPSSSSDYVDILPDNRVTDVIGIYFDSQGANPDNPEDSTASFYTEGQDFTVIGNRIDWSIAYENGTLKSGCLAPTAGTSYYVTYKHNVVNKLYISFRCMYKEYETNKALWTSAVTKSYTGSCTPGHDYRSNPLPSKTSEVDWGTIPSNVDIDTLFYVLNDDNIWVSTFFDNNVVVGSLRNRVPSTDWLPTIHNGYYYLGKDEYYLFTEPKEFTPTRSEVETATNVTYVPCKYGNGIFIEEGTTNIILNSGFDKLGNKTVIFQDSLSRVV